MRAFLRVLIIMKLCDFRADAHTLWLKVNRPLAFLWKHRPTFRFFKVTISLVLVLSLVLVGFGSSIFGGLDEFGKGTAETSLVRCNTTPPTGTAQVQEGSSLHGMHSGDDSLPLESEQTSGGSSADNWDWLADYGVDSYSADDGSLTLVFSDGTSADFGNPESLYWAAGSEPYDYSAVTEPAQSGLAYGSPVSLVLSKLKYLVGKVGQFTGTHPMRDMYVAFVMASCSFGCAISADVSEMASKITADSPAIIRILESDSIVISEEDSVIWAADALQTIYAREGAVTAETISKDFPGVIEEEAATYLETGELISGNSGGFVSALYDYAASNSVTASFINANSDFFLWLGQNFFGFTPYGELVPSDGSYISMGDYSIEYGASPYQDFSAKYTADYTAANWLFSFNYDDTPQYSVVVWDPLHSSEGNVYDFQLASSSSTLYRMSLIRSDGSSPTRYEYILMNYDKSSIQAYTNSSDRGGYLVLETPSSTLDYSYRLNSANSYNFYDNQGNLIGSYSNGAVSGDLGMTGGTSADVPTLLGTDAAFDSAGNLTDAGILNLGNPTADGYVAPGSFADFVADTAATATETPQAAVKADSVATDGTTVADSVAEKAAANPTTTVTVPDSDMDAFLFSDLETKFPFSVPWDLKLMVDALTAPPVAPNFDWTFDFANAGTYSYHLDFSSFDSVAAVGRTCLVVLFAFLLAFVTMNLKKL